MRVSEIVPRLVLINEKIATKRKTAASENIVSESYRALQKGSGGERKRLIQETLSTSLRTIEYVKRKGLLNL